MSDAANLKDDPEAYIDALVKSGRYESRDAAMKEAVRLLEYKEKRLAELNAALDRGLADVEAGRVKPIEEVADRLKAKYRAMQKRERRA
jgi:antitoxin ParD1/3/4